MKPKAQRDWVTYPKVKCWQTLTEAGRVLATSGQAFGCGHSVMEGVCGRLGGCEAPRARACLLRPRGSCNTWAIGVRWAPLCVWNTRVGGGSGFSLWAPCPTGAMLGRPVNKAHPRCLHSETVSALTTSTTASEHRARKKLRKSLSTEKSKPMFPIRGGCLHSLYYFRTQCVWLNTGRSHQRNLETWASVLSLPVTGLPDGSAVKNLPAIQEMQEMCISWSLGWEDLLEEAWQPTPVFLPGESCGQRSLVGYSPWGHRESDTTAATEHPHTSSYWPWALGKIAWFSCLSFPGGYNLSMLWLSMRGLLLKGLQDATMH